MQHLSGRLGKRKVFVADSCTSFSSPSFPRVAWLCCLHRSTQNRAKCFESVTERGRRLFGAARCLAHYSISGATSYAMSPLGRVFSAYVGRPRGMYRVTPVVADLGLVDLYLMFH